MLKSILNLDGANVLGREEKKEILGGISPGICPSAGEPCDDQNPNWIPFSCFAGPQNLCCINGVLVAVIEDQCNPL